MLQGSVRLQGDAYEGGESNRKKRFGTVILEIGEDGIGHLSSREFALTREVPGWRLERMLSQLLFGGFVGVLANSTFLTFRY